MHLASLQPKGSDRVVGDRVVDAVVIGLATRRPLPVPTVVATDRSWRTSRPVARVVGIVMMSLAVMASIVVTPARADAEPLAQTVEAPTAPVDPVDPVAPAPVAEPGTVTINLNNEGGTEGTVAASQPLAIVLLLTIIALAPALLILLTGFTRIIIVLGLTRNAMNLQGVPPNQVLIGLGLFLTTFVMAPTFSEVNETALQPYLNSEIDQSVAFERGIEPFREFMFDHTRDEDLGLFVRLSGAERPTTEADVPTTTLVPAFVISELRAAFLIGFIIFIPFLVIDMVVSAALMSMGMVMLPPVLISLPFKLLLFVVVDGWTLIISSLVESFGT